MAREMTVTRISILTIPMNCERMNEVTMLTKLQLGIQKACTIPIDSKTRSNWSTLITTLEVCTLYDTAFKMDTTSL